MKSCLKKVVLSASALLSFGVCAGTLLEDLSTNENLVATSPYASGGDVILKLGDNEYVHVFANAAAAARFVPSVNLTARVLVVGGGGGAGCGFKPDTWQFATGGGGGGGGVREYTGVTLAKSSAYTVTVGAGGQGAANVTTQGGTGASTSLVGPDVNCEVAGGGGGGSATNDVGFASGLSAATGGGAAGWAAKAADPSLFGTPGSGSDYGLGGGATSVNNKNVCGGGGGGAGQAGLPGGHTSGTAGVQVGGNGLLTDILGSDFYFGGGGAGGSHSVNGTGAFRNLGGLGGGGMSYANSYATCVAEEGAAGYGGGGAAGWVCGGSASIFGRAGGCGSVIVRYTHTPSGDAPLLSGVTVRSADGGHRAVVSGFVSGFGSSASASVAVKIWPKADPSTVLTRTVVVPSTQTDAFLQGVGGLNPGVEYDYEVYTDPADKVTGTLVSESGNPGLTTSAASAQAVSDSPYEKYLVLPTGTHDVTVAGGYVDLLVVGGGGAGGYGGNSAKDGGSAGGGGGGVLHAGRRYFSGGTYRVTVGAGGQPMANKSSAAGWGEISSVMLSSSSDATFVFPAVVAYGGGRGQSWELNTIEDGTCASTGGAARNSKSPSDRIMEGQGHIGGYVGPDFAAGGGGGAGGPGVSGAAHKAGDGGPGKASSVTGTIAYYGAGGGGGTGGSGSAQRPGLGGSGVGGLGYDYQNSKVAPGDGVAGTGSGGGGGGSSKPSGGAGGDGTVIFRYFDATGLTGRLTPILAWFPEQYVAGVSVLTFSVAVPFAGEGSDGVSLSARYWTNAEDCGDASKATDIVLDANFMDPTTRTFSLTGLSPARTYFVQVLATNGSGSEASSIYEMRTLQGLGTALTRTQLQAFNTFGYSVSQLGTGVSTLKLMASQDGGETWQQAGDSWTATAGDSLQVSRNLLEVEGFAFGVSTMCKLVLENADSDSGVPATSSETETVTFMLSDEAVYTWSDAVTDGRWDDPTSWTCSLDGYGLGRSLGYPVYGSSVKFKNNQTNIVRLVKNETCHALYYNIEKADITYVGTNVTLSTLNHHAEHTKSTKNSTFTFDGVNFTNGGGAFQPQAGCKLVARNGARISFNLNASSGTLTVDVGSGCVVSGTGFVMNGSGNALLVEDGLAVASSGTLSCLNTTVTVRGNRPALQARTGLALKSCLIDFYLPAEPYGEEMIESEDLWLARAPLRKNYIKDNSTHSLEGSTIHINRKSPAKRCTGERDYLLFDARAGQYAASSGIVTNGLQVTGLEAGEYLYCEYDSPQTANPTRVYVHVKGGSGFQIRLR